MSTDFTLHFDPIGDVLDAARACEGSVFLDQYGNTTAQWEEEYGPYDNTSAFIAVTEPGGDAVAAMRLILPSVVGLKTLVDVGRPPWSIDGRRSARAAAMSIDSTWDVATIAIRKGTSRGSLLSASLYHGLLLATRANAARWIVMIMDVRARRLLNMIGLRTHVLPGTNLAPYLGSAASVPLWAEVAPMVDNQRRTNPDAYRLVSLGVGLDAVAVPEASIFVLKTRVEPGLVSGQAVPVSANLSGRASV
jgi:hypothetical protein